MSVVNAIGRMLPETIAQQRRIIADGGTIVNLTWMNLVIRTLKSMGIYGNAKLLTDANFGVKKDVTGAVSKLYDISGNNNDAVQATGASQPIWSNGTITYDGSNDWLDCGNSSTLDVGNMTIFLKVLFASPYTGYHGIISKNLYTASKGWLFYIDTNGTTLKFIRGGGLGVSVVNPLSNGLLHSVIGTYEGTIMTLYDNNTVKGTSSQTIVNDSTLSLLIGCRDLYKAKFNGQINSSTIFNIALTQPQIATLYNLGL